MLHLLPLVKGTTAGGTPRSVRVSTASGQCVAGEFDMRPPFTGDTLQNSDHQGKSCRQVRRIINSHCGQTQKVMRTLVLRRNVYRQTASVVYSLGITHQPEDASSTSTQIKVNKV